MTKEEKNRKLAEWLEPLSSLPNEDDSEEMQAYESEAWIATFRLSRVTGMHVPSWEPRDFYTDEAANALLLDRLLSEGCPPDDLPTNFKWAWQWVGQLIMREIQFHQNNDRKTAICEAVLKLMEAQ
jgi:hypothetical protein